MDVDPTALASGAAGFALLVALAGASASTVGGRVPDVGDSGE